MLSSVRRLPITNVHRLLLCKTVTYITVITHVRCLMENSKAISVFGLFICQRSHEAGPYYVLCICIRKNIWGKKATCVMIWWQYNTGSGVFWWLKCNTMLLQGEVELLDQNHQILQYIFVTEICNLCNKTLSKLITG